MADRLKRTARARALAARVKGPLGTVRFFLGRMAEDNISGTAAALCFATALAIVPALAVILGTMTAFPAFDHFRVSLQNVLVSNLLPDTGLKIQDEVAAFVTAAGKLTAFGLMGLAVTALLLLFTIEGAFNRIFRVAHKRPVLLRIAVLWAVLTVTPFLIAISVTFFGYSAAFVPTGFFTELVSVATGHIIPALCSWGGLALLYFSVPSRRVRWRDALTGAWLSAVLFTVLGTGFGLYVKGLTPYSAIYGALAAVPVFLLWMYLIWFVILAGAVITAALSDWRLMRAGLASGPGVKLAVALELLDCLAAAFREGRIMSSEELALTIQVPEAFVRPVLDQLRTNSYIASNEAGQWSLSRDLETVQLAELMHGFGFGLGPAIDQLRDSPAGERVAAYLAPLFHTESDLLRVSLARVMRGNAGGNAPIADGPF